MRWRPALSAGVIVALAVAVWAAVSSGGDDPPDTTVAALTTSTAATATTVTTMAAVTATTADSPTATAPTSTATTATTTDSEVRVEEVRLILEDLYFRWFDAIYRNDEAAVREVVATEARLAAFHEMAANHGYPSPPAREAVRVLELTVLLDSPDCLVVFNTLDLSEWLGDGERSSGVDVLWPHETGWRRATLWTHPNDLWRTDCEADRSDELP